MSERIQVPGPNDRTIEVLTGGADDGLCLLFHGGSPSAVAEGPVFDEAARAAGLRVVTYSRLRLIQSQKDASRAARLDRILTDLKRLGGVS